MIDKSIQIEAEAAAFRKLVGHLRERTDVQNIDLMELAGFCATACRSSTEQKSNAA